MWLVGGYCGLYGGTCVVCKVVGMLYGIWVVGRVAAGVGATVWGWVEGMGVCWVVVKV